MKSERSGNVSIALVGNLASGKSTFAGLLQRSMSRPFAVCLEDPKDYPFVSRAFADPARWSCVNQLDFIVTKARQQAELIKLNGLYIQEMDCFATHLIWSPVLLELGFITPEELELLNRVYATLAEVYPVRADFHLYLKCEPNVVMQRIVDRGRPYEASEPGLVELIMRLHGRLEEVMQSQQSAILIDTSNLDLLRESQNLDNLLTLIAKKISVRWDCT